MGQKVAQLAARKRSLLFTSLQAKLATYFGRTYGAPAARDVRVENGAVTVREGVHGCVPGIAVLCDFCGEVGERGMDDVQRGRVLRLRVKPAVAVVYEITVRWETQREKGGKRSEGNSGGGEEENKN